MPKLKRNSKVNECEPYKLDLADYATGEMTFLTKEKQRRLFDHLRRCASCREMFFDYENIYSLLVTTAHVQKPEFIDRMNRLKEQFKRESVEGVLVIEPIPGEKFLDHEKDIGSHAGTLWHCLGKNGRIKESDLKRKAKLPVKTFDRAIGWLARENKIHRTRVKKTKFVYLTQEEREIYQAQAQV